MQKYFFLLLLVCLVFNCSENNNGVSYSNNEIAEFKDIAWNDLSANELETVIISKEEAKIQYSLVKREDDLWFYKTENNAEYAFAVTNPEIDYRNNQIFIVVTINTTIDSLLGPIVVIIEPNSKMVFGRGFRY